MSRVTNDLNAVRMVLGPGIMYTGTTIATMVMAIYFMVKLSPVLTMWVLIPVPFVAFAVRYFGQIIHRLSEQIQAALGVLSTRAQENLTGIRVIRAYAQEKPEIESFDRANRDYVDHNIKLIGSWSLFFPALAALIGVTVAILLGMGGIQVINEKISLGTFLAFYTFLVQLVFPMIAIGFVTNIFQRGAASMGRLNYVLTAQPNIRNNAALGAETPFSAANRGRGQPNERPGAETNGAKSGIRGEIEFRHLTFAYPTGSNGAAGPPVLSDINLHIPAGSSLAIVGPTGSGKSTLAALVARLWEAPPWNPADRRPLHPRVFASRRCGVRSGMCHRILSCLAKPSAKTSLSGSMTTRKNRCLRPLRLRACPAKSRASRHDSIRWSVSAA